MNVSERELKRGAIWTLCNPHEEVSDLMVSGLKVDEIVAGSLVTQIINFSLCVFPFDFGFNFGVWNQVNKII